ncbi:MAG: hypothetical protein GYB33_14690 [Gammaproteobacteria bacterium]|uniref:hypothetical protein n=1 Tax=Pseudomaricurvus alcaniphilus TaxID=1166482 RepID=UPI00140B2C3F|nr:hypothetical protein [Pseudomaricurvus alcaniphilus]MBR9911590.1 hypothetical protein [Gammaproteobacteria bacterium]NHN39466.1 hypothetical protein [Pseudomaricurvus alcaniphilus]
MKKSEKVTKVTAEAADILFKGTFSHVLIPVGNTLKSGIFRQQYGNCSNGY